MAATTLAETVLDEIVSAEGNLTLTNGHVKAGVQSSTYAIYG